MTERIATLEIEPSPVQDDYPNPILLKVNSKLLYVQHYYMAESVFAMRLVNLRSVTCYTDQNFKKNAHSLYLGKKFE